QQVKVRRRVRPRLGIVFVGHELDVAPVSPRIENERIAELPRITRPYAGLTHRVDRHDTFGRNGVVIGRPGHVHPVEQPDIERVPLQLLESVLPLWNARDVLRYLKGSSPGRPDAR